MKQNKVWSEEQEKLLAQLLEAEGFEPEDARRITRRRDSADAPLSFTQQRLWLLDQLSPGNPAYNVPLAVRFDGRLNLPALARVLREVVRRHEALRTTFPASGGRPRQSVAAPPEGFQLPLIDLSSLEAPRREAEALRLAAQEALYSFDLTRGPLLRARVLRLAVDEHVLLLSMHHIVSDGWSVGVLFNELCRLYEAFIEGRESPLPELPVQYADYAAWQREHFGSGAFAEHVRYWRERLSGAPSVLELPTDRPRPARQSWRGAAQSFNLGEPLTSALKEVSRERGGTLFMLLLAALKLLLYRYTGQEDVLVGTPIAGRTRPEVEGLIGCFINTLALRARLDAAEGFDTLLERVREVCLGAYEHQEMPFEKIVEELQPERSLSHAPLFQVMFTLQNVPGGAVSLPGLRLSTFALAQQTTKFDLSLVMFEERPGDLSGILLYNADLFEPETARRMAGHYMKLLEGIAADPRRRVRDLPLMSEEERRAVFEEWNRTETECPSPSYVHEMFEQQARLSPAAVAVEAEHEQLSYADLNLRAESLARRLRSRGVGACVHVGVCLERSPEMVVAVLAILKAGGAYVPLDPAYPPQRLAYMVEDARLKVIVSRRHLAERLPEDDAELLLLDEEGGTDAPVPPDAETRARVSDEQPAYVIYTSGSTGMPKGVSVSHRAVCNHLRWRQAAYPLTAADGFLQKASLGFDISAWEIFSPLSAGARLVLAWPGAQGDCGHLVRLIGERGVTTAHFGPALLRVFLDEPGVEGLGSLRRVFCGGEPLTRELQEKFFSRLGAELHHQYGPTETTIDVTAWACERDGAPRHIPIGRPISNVQTYVLDARLEPVAPGTPGELCIGGASLAHGYVGRPAPTAERFVPDPFSAQPGARLYRTGDRVRHMPDGSLQYLGRFDRQVKLRGFRIEPGEIEAVLAGHTDVREAVALVREDGGERRLAAYYVAAPHAEPGDGELRAYLAERLPDYMVPSVFVPLERLPLNVNGKVDRAALPEPGRPPRTERYAAPRNELEQKLADIWAELLRLESVGVDENFFELGGHSLLATQVISRVNESWQVEVPLRALFESPTVGGLAEVVARQAGQQSTRPAPINPGARSLEEQTLAGVELMSDEEVDAVLARMLSEKEGDA